MSKYVLMHGSFVEVPEDELMHYKYIKRERTPAGTWRYYYKEDALQNDKRDYYKANMKMQKAAYDHNVAKSKGPEILSGVVLEKGQLRIESNPTTYRKLQAAKVEAKVEKFVYDLNRVSTLPARTISKGIVKVGNLLSKLSMKNKKVTNKPKQNTIVRSK